MLSQRFSIALLSSIERLNELCSSAQTLKEDSINQERKSQVDQVCAEIDYHSKKVICEMSEWDNKARDKKPMMDFIEVHHPFDLVAKVDSLKASLLAMYNTVVKSENFDKKPSPNVSDSYLPITRLPFEHLKKFRGEKSKWVFFLNSFESLVGSQPGSRLQKLNVLFNHLEGEAFEVVKHYGLYESNYEVVLNVLKKKYGDEEDQYERLLSELTDNSLKNDVIRLRKVLATVGQLKALKGDNDAQAVKVLVMKSLPLFAYERWIKKFPANATITLSSIILFLEETISYRERLYERFPQNFKERLILDTRNNLNRPRDVRRDTNRSQNVRSSAFFMKNNFSRTSPNAKCVFCDGNHWSNTCSTLCSYKDRLDFVRKHKLCFLCLGNHLKSSCSSSRSCFYCKGKHHSALCRSGNNEMVSSNNAKSKPKFTDTSGHQSSSSVNASTYDGNDSESELVSLLMCLFVEVFAGGNSIKIPILLDSGAQHSYVAHWVPEQLGLNLGDPKLIRITAFGETVASTFETYEVKLSIRAEKVKSIEISAFTVQKLVRPIPWVDTRDGNCDFLHGWKLNTRLNMIKPALIVGCDYFEKFFIASPVHLPSGFYLYRTHIGEFIAGSGYIINHQKLATGVISSLIATNSSKSDEIEQFWQLEKTGINDEDDVSMDEYARQIFLKTIKQLPDGRYQVNFPWKDLQPVVPANFGLAFGRLKAVLKSLSKNVAALLEYDLVFQEQLRNGIIEKVDESSTINPQIISYIPHHAVFAHNKVRIVYDASAKTRGNRSINELLLRGPPGVNDITGILIRSRLHQNIVVADVEKAFHQIAVSELQRDVTRFLWLQDLRKECTEDNLQIFRFCRVPFGLICSPFLLNASIKYHFERSNSVIKQDILANLYVDNILIGATNNINTHQIYEELKSQFNFLKMNVCAFLTNDFQLMESIPTEDKYPISKGVKLLGIEWDVTKDLYIIRLGKPKLQLSTKRLVLQFIASQYDPLGLISPALIKLKNFLKLVWLHELDWDAKFSPGLYLKLAELLDEWNDVTVFEVNRCAMISSRLSNCDYRSVSDSFDNVSLHIFVDASKIGMCACIFLRYCINDAILCSIIFAKARLLPKTASTIPRAELMAVELGTKLDSYVRAQLKSHIGWEVGESYIWSDSMCVLHWIHRSNIEVKDRLVYNRLTKIRQFKGNFRFVSSNDNPADVGTRGITPQDLKNTQIWWNGPHWLSYEEEHWPAQKFETCDDQLCCTIANIGTESLNLNKFSNYRGLLRTYTWVFRFLNNCRQQPRISNNWFSTSELKQTEMKIIKYVQRNISLAEKSRYALVEQDGIYVGFGRTSIPLIFMPSNHHVTYLIILDVHEKLMHASCEVVRAELIRKWWFPRSQRTVKKVIRNRCMLCRRFNTSPFQLPNMPQLPETRLQRSYPFEHIGTDFAGPVRVKSKNGVTKQWIWLVTCFTTRAVFLELFETMTLVTFMQYYRRFISLRGSPRSIYSDNAKTFVAASKLLHAIRKKVEEEGVTWYFSTEYAPWQGGVFERMVGLIKFALKRAIGKRILTSEEFRTLLYEVAATVNRRPLGTVNSCDLNFIRPCDLMFMPHSNVCILPPSEVVKDLKGKNLISLWKENLKILDQFWLLWRGKYIQSIRSRRTHHFNSRSAVSRPPRVGELVLITSMAPRNEWRVAKISGVKTSSDGLIRSVQLQLPDGTMTRRTINCICPLELDNFD